MFFQVLRSSFNYFQISQNRNQTQANSLTVMMTFTNDVPKSINGNTDLQVHFVVFLELVYFKTTPKMMKRKQVDCYCDGIVLEIYLDLKFQWPEEGLNSWPNGLGNYFVCKRFEVQTLLWSLEFVIQINLEHDTIAVWNLARSWSIWSCFLICLCCIYEQIHFTFFFSHS